MEKVLITGNGFDLYHNLPTNYKDFMFVLRKIEEIDLEKRKNVTFNYIFDDYPNEKILLKIKENYNTEKIEFDIEKLKELKALFRKNTWYKHFKSILKIETWIDFEQEIKKALNFIVKSFEIIQDSKIFTELNHVPNFPEKCSLKFNTKEINILKHFDIISGRTYIKKEFKYKINNKYYFSIDDYHELKEQEILEDLATSLDNFIEIFNSYFTNIINLFYSKNKRKIDSSLLSKINYFFTFNYTSTIENFYSGKDVNYIHGKANEVNNLQNMVLGIDDINEKLKEHKMFTFTKYFQKLDKNTDYQFLKLIENDIIFDIKDDNFIFYIWGWSMDKSDENYVLELLNSLASNHENKIIIFYHSKNSKSFVLKNLLSIADRLTIENAMKNNQIVFIELDSEEKNIRLI